MGIWHNVTTGSEQGGGPALASCLVTLADGTQADIATSILHEAGGLQIQGAGRQTELQPSAPANATVAVDNSAGDHTPGRAAAAAPLNLGTQVRYRETVGRKTFDLFAGAFEQPVASMGMLPNGAGDVVQATAIDWIGQQGNARKFISNLAEHIIYNGRDTLEAYWPLTETTYPLLDVVGGQPEMLVETIVSGLAGNVKSSPTVELAAGAGPPNDDARLVVVDTNHSAIQTVSGPQLSSIPTVSMQPGQVMTLVAWYDLTFPTTEAMDLLHIQAGTAGDFLQIDLVYNTPANPGLWQMDVSSASELSGTITATPKYGLIPMAIRYGYSPSVMELWIGRRRVTGTLSGSTPGGATTTSQVRLLSFGPAGTVGHAQLYVGGASDFTFEDYLAQIDHATNGLTGGLRWQRTDERIRQLLRYAGLTDAQMDLEPGVAYMPRASLAGKTVMAAVQSAVDTEQGRLLVAGNGNIRFDNRITTRYNL